MYQKGGFRAMDWLTLALMLVAVYVAVMTLVRLMRSRRDQLVSEVQQQIEARRRKSGAAQNQNVKR